MCNHEEWQNVRRRVEQAVDENQLRELVEDAAARVEALMDQLKRSGCWSQDAEWVRGRGRRSRTEWVA
jgi:hypothetical protein